MPNPQIYTTELERFRKKYNMPEYDLKALESVDHNFQHLNNFLFESSASANPAAQFVNWATRTMGMCFEAKTSLRKDGKYMFNPQDFLRDFEKLASAKYFSELSDGEEPTRKRYAGVKKRELKNILINNLEDMNKTLPTLWAEKLKKGTMTQNELLLTAGNVMDNMDNVIKSNDVPLEDQIINVVAAYETMKQVRESRTGFWGWLWKFIFRERNEIEETNLNVFESQVNRLREKGYPVDKIAAEITGKTVLGLEVEKEQSKAPAESKENPVKQAFQPINFEPCAKKIGNAYLETSKKVIKEILEKLPVTNKYGGLFREQTLEVMIAGQAFNKFNELNEQFDKDMQNGNQKDAIVKLVRESFKVAQAVSVMATSGCDVDKIDACAMIAKLFIDNFTAVSTYPELDGIVNEYMKDNIALYNEIETKGLSYGKEIDNYAVDYVPSEEYFKEPAFGEENPFVESNVNKSAPVHQQPQINAPSLDK